MGLIRALASFGLGCAQAALERRRQNAFEAEVAQFVRQREYLEAWMFAAWVADRAQALLEHEHELVSSGRSSRELSDEVDDWADAARQWAAYVESLGRQR